MNDNEILKKLKKLRSQDPNFSSSRVFSSVSTKPLEVALSAFNIFADTNALDEHLFGTPKKLEDECISWMGNLLHNPSAKGYITTGGTEANMFAFLVARGSKNTKNEIIIPESAHYSFEKLTRMLNLKINYAATDKNFRADVSDIKKKINEKTLAVVATAGTSALGMVDPADKINELLNEFDQDIFFHVDAAFGGFVIPFLDDDKKMNMKYDFELANVSSITIDPHKMGTAPIPSGAILLRDDKLLKELKITPPYLPVETHTLLGTRSGGAIAATWATFKSIGIPGYKKIVKYCMENTEFLCRELKNRGFELVTEPDLNFIGVKIKDITYGKKIVKKLESIGWKVSMNQKPVSLRLVVMPHINKNNILKFVDDFERIAKEI
ncbi:MAG: tyrosine decarboxylase MfnA [Candidatus Altiarchaeales archaeon HGW-Altiarchaeales-3]|nr:MAG: tyrosine decarboxylase MfnA [Candidatus Altiarchaeales archaeon HGW-Altiarchaeales-3]